MEEIIPVDYFTPGATSTTMAHEDRLLPEPTMEASSRGATKKKRLPFGSADGMSD